MVSKPWRLKEVLSSDNSLLTLVGLGKEGFYLFHQKVSSPDNKERAQLIAKKLVAEVKDAPGLEDIFFAVLERLMHAHLVNLSRGKDIATQHVRTMLETQNAFIHVLVREYLAVNLEETMATASMNLLERYNQGDSPAKQPTLMESLERSKAPSKPVNPIVKAITDRTQDFQKNARFQRMMFYFLNAIRRLSVGDDGLTEVTKRMVCQYIMNNHILTAIETRFQTLLTEEYDSESGRRERVVREHTANLETVVKDGEDSLTAACMTQATLDVMDGPQPLPFERSSHHSVCSHHLRGLAKAARRANVVNFRLDESEGVNVTKAKAVFNAANAVAENYQHGTPDDAAKHQGYLDRKLFHRGWHYKEANAIWHQLRKQGVDTVAKMEDFVISILHDVTADKHGIKPHGSFFNLLRYLINISRSKAGFYCESESDVCPSSHRDVTLEDQIEQLAADDAKRKEREKDQTEVVDFVASSITVRTDAATARRRSAVPPPIVCTPPTAQSLQALQAPHPAGLTGDESRQSSAATMVQDPSERARGKEECEHDVTAVGHKQHSSSTQCITAATAKRKPKPHEEEPMTVEQQLQYERALQAAGLTRKEPHSKGCRGSCHQHRRPRNGQRRQSIAQFASGATNGSAYTMRFGLC